MTSATTSTATTRPEPPRRRSGEAGAGVGLFICMLVVTLLLVGGATLLIRRAQAQYDQRELAQRIERISLRGGIAVMGVIDEPDLLSPDAPSWERAIATPIRLGPQNMAMPALEQPTISQVMIHALATPTRLAIRVTWEDPQVDGNVDAARFSDAAALQFPLAADASIMMGAPQVPVQILLWKAVWQKDVDEHFQDVQDLHPNYWADQYWFAKPAATQPASAATPYRVPESFQDPRSHAWFPAKQADNPNAQWQRTQPVEELSAEGFGTLSTQRDSATQGRGVWQNGRWSVTFIRPLRTGDAFDAQIHGTGQLAVAVWEGSSGNVGGRKHHTQWTPFEIVR